MIAAILLAAGVARRFGGPKLLQDLAGKPVVRWSAEGLTGAPVDEIVVVVPPAHEAIRRALAGLRLDARFVVNPRPDEGMGASLACGIAALGLNTEAALVALADEPRSPRHALMQVIERYRAGGAAVVVPRFHGTRGHPVLFDRSVFPELRALSGDQGARSVTDRDPARLAFVDIDAPQPVDIDTPQDLMLLRSTEQGRDWLIDRLMPEFDERASYGMDVSVSPVTVYHALLETNLAESLVSRLLMMIRSLGRRSAGTLRLRDLPARGAFFRLADDPPREIVIGVVGRFWALRANVCDGDAISFRLPAPAGTAKAAWNFRVEPAPGGSRLTTETRILCADDESRRSFRRYWSVIGPFSGVIRLEALRLIRRQAQFTSSLPPTLP